MYEDHARWMIWALSERLRKRCLNKKPRAVAWRRRQLAQSCSKLFALETGDLNDVKLSSDEESMKAHDLQNRWILIAFTCKFTTFVSPRRLARLWHCWYRAFARELCINATIKFIDFDSRDLVSRWRAYKNVARTKYSWLVQWNSVRRLLNFTTSVADETNVPGAFPKALERSAVITCRQWMSVYELLSIVDVTWRRTSVFLLATFRTNMPNKETMSSVCCWSKKNMRRTSPE